MIKQTLNDVCTLIVDCEHKTASIQPTGIPSIRTPNIGKGRLILDTVNRVSEETYMAWTKRAIPQANDLILAREAPIGNVAIILPKQKVCLGQRTVLIRPNKNKVDSQYMCYLLLGDEIQGKIISVSNGATVHHLNMEDIRSLELPELPTLPTQRKIAAILSAYDDLIENNTRRIKILEEMAQALYREWFVKFRFPGHEKVRMVETELGMVPEGWEVKKLSALVETQYGYTESASNTEIGPKYIRGMDINKTSFIEWDTVPFCPINANDYSKYKIKVGDILVIRMADPGKVGIIEKNIDAVFASYLIRLKFKSNRLSPYYLFYFLLSDRYQGYVTGASTGTTRKSASAGVITDINMVIPPDDIRIQFEDSASTIRIVLNNILDRNTNLRRTRDLLLPKLISGEVDVEKIDVRTPDNGSGTA